ncbi:MAG: hypothetical protein QGG48_11585 [Desulfatiglandales bacterium]|jgi:hypothetical protein|nr:hypothetical protein [Desulfatiglandales bacterium]
MEEMVREISDALVYLQSAKTVVINEELAQNINDWEATAKGMAMSFE